MEPAGRADVIAEMVRAHFPDAADYLGHKNTLIAVQESLAGRSPGEVFKEAKGGADLSFIEVVTFIFAATAFIKDCWDLRDRLTQQRGQPPSPAELQKQIEQQGIKPPTSGKNATGTMPPEALSALVADVAKQP